MYSRLFSPVQNQSYFLFGPRGTGKTSFLLNYYPTSAYIDLLEDEIYNRLLAHPSDLLNYVEVEKLKYPIVIDEIQKIPELLDEVHRLIERKKLTFVLTGSSSRKLKQSGANLLAGRAFSYSLFPLTALELKEDFDIKKSLHYGHLPMAINSKHPQKFLESYAKTYLKEEIQLEGLTRNIQAFARFLEAASFSQGGQLVLSKIASDCSVHRKVVEDYFYILQDLLLSIELPIFTKRAKRELIAKRKFYFFDVGVYRTFRPKGPLDSDEEINGLALETLIVQEVRAINCYLEWGYEMYYWRTKKKEEVDLILYGKRGLRAIEIKSSAKIRSSDLKSLLLFAEDYPEANLYCIYGGTRETIMDGVKLIPANLFLSKIESML